MTCSAWETGNSATPLSLGIGSGVAHWIPAPPMFVRQKPTGHDAHDRKETKRCSTTAAVTSVHLAPLLPHRLQVMQIFHFSVSCRRSFCFLACTDALCEQRWSFFVRSSCGCVVRAWVSVGCFQHVGTLGLNLRWWMRCAFARTASSSSRVVELGFGTEELRPSPVDQRARHTPSNFSFLSLVNLWIH